MLNTQQAAELLGISAATLTVLRSKGVGCPFYKEGNRVYYDERDIAAHAKIACAAQSPTTRRLHTIRVMKGGELHSIQRRAGETLQQAADLLAMYPSFVGCTFKEAPEVPIDKGQRERLFLMFDKHVEELKAAFVQAAAGPNPAAQNAGINAARKVFGQIVREALK